MSVRTARALPVLIGISDDDERKETWGRLLELRPDGGCLSTRTRLRPRESLSLGFELAGERFDGRKARVLSSGNDEDGYCICEFGFRDADTEGLARLLRRIS